ncbi:glucose-6-phosphate dehydrogenase [Pilimelia columellifera]|uniref:Glucose-6-phosphate 1-dehydrogenase n=1 Tax=Pilimelia columellifera subsp. columellifera TaxID=706583 RepID=A0ABN3NMZ9_9ACTN
MNLAGRTAGRSTSTATASAPAETRADGRAGLVGSAAAASLDASFRDDRSAPPATMVIFGASGDLTRRKLIPAVLNLARHKRLTQQFAVVGVARSQLDDDQFAAAAFGDADTRSMPSLHGGIRYVSGGYDDPATYARLAELLVDLDTSRGVAGNRLFYLATPPQAFPKIINGLAGAGLNRPTGDSFARVVIEKPYGHHETSARALDACVHRAFDESQVFRIDHYLGKNTVQNVMALRFANAIFQPIWNRSWVDHVQITVAETLGVGSRGSFYEHAGAMRDIVQNHVLQVLALALMEPPASFSAEAIRNEKVKLLQAIRLPGDRDIDDLAVRGQYTRGGTRFELMPGYREEPGVDPLSRTETYAAMRLDVDNWRWAGVPFYVRTGKRLPSRVTEVVLQFQRPPHLPISAAQVREMDPDALILRIQPDEGITLRFGAKVPGHSFRVRSASMEFSYGDTFREESPEAYERLLLDALIGDPTLFIRSDEVQQCWRIVDPIIDRWSQDDRPIPTYEAASWGPMDADRLIGRSGRVWRNGN